MSKELLSERCKSVKMFSVMEILHRAQCMQRAGIDVVHLEAGEPDFDTPECIIERGIVALQDGLTHYTASHGIVELRQEVAKHFLNNYGVTISEDQVFIFPGSSIGMKFFFEALLNQGDEVILSDPCYAVYPTFVEHVGGVVKAVPTYEEEGFQYRPEDVRKAVSERTKAIIINSPSNPTGIIMEKERMQAIADIANGVGLAPEQRAPLIFSDEIYHGLNYEGDMHSILEFTKNAVVSNGFSKAYAMTGWRVGYLVVPEWCVEALTAFMQRFLLSTNTVAQVAALHALQNSAHQTVRMRDVYNERRKYVLKALRELGFKIPVEPCGAFYLLFNARHLAKKFDGSSHALAFDILDKAHVGVTPGSEFGMQAEGFLRISYATSMENLEKGMQRLGEYIKTYHS